MSDWSARRRVHLLLNTDGFKKSEPVAFDDELSRLAFQVENRSGRDHDGSFEVNGLPDGDYEVLLNGRKVHSFASEAGGTFLCLFRVTTAPDHAVLIRQL